MSAVANSTVPVQIESINTGNPVSESATIAIAGAVNYCLSNKPAVGDMMMSALDEVTFQAQRDTTWWLCDGRSALGTVFQALTTLTVIPDMRGTFPRGKDNGRGLNPNGNLAIGTFTADQFTAHDHAFELTQRPANNGANPPALGTDTPGGTLGSQTTSAAGGAETAPKSTTVNWFIKVNV